MISHSSFEFSYPDPGGLYTSTIVIGSPFVITLKQQNWLNLFILNLSHTKILSPDFVYTNNPPPTPFVVSSLSLRRSVSSWYPGSDRVASEIAALHHVSVSKIISGLLSTADTDSSFILEKTL